MTRIFLIAISAAALAPAENVKTPLLPRDREVALALSAAPAAVAENATVYVLEASGYVKAREGSNAYVCLVGRTDHALDLTPVCHDRNGAEAALPPAFLRAELRARGLSEAEVRAEIAEGYRSGRFRAPKPGGISYMISTEGYTIDPKTGAKQMVPPHVMVYAPYMTNADLGIPAGRLTEMQRAGMPFMRGEGQPDGYIIIMAPSEKHAH